MTPWGQAATEEAKANGAWEAVDPRPLFEDSEGFLRKTTRDQGKKAEDDPRGHED
jgi:hypothetical protein